MTRDWVSDKSSDGWHMRCDEIGCTTRSDARRWHTDLPLEEFIAKGWFIAKVHGDKCPECLATMKKKGWVPDPINEYGDK